MSTVLDELVRLLRVERHTDTRFRGQSQDLGWAQVFGGQVLGQALNAAAQTVTPERACHSLQASFLRPGDATQPIDYDVEPTRDGKSFSTRRVVASQGEVPIFHLSASFHVDEPGYEHHAPMPAVKGPEGLRSERELWAVHHDKLPPRLLARVLAERPIELRPVDPMDFFSPLPKAPHHAVWMKAAGPLPSSSPDDDLLHRCLLAYCSDFSFVPTALRPHAVSWIDTRVHIASIDHALWLHRPCRIDEWLLHVMESPSAAGGRGFVRGGLYDRAGRLVASTAQEGLIRRRSTQLR
jgi:acyl-CoA thioesterase II